MYIYISPICNVVASLFSLNRIKIRDSPFTIPNTISEALTKREWKDDMREEMSALENNKTWEIVERPKGKNIVDCKWIFTLKYKVDGSLERHKARLVAKG